MNNELKIQTPLDIARPKKLHLRPRTSTERHMTDIHVGIRKNGKANPTHAGIRKWLESRLEIDQE